ncbi:unnamed protein product [Pleuronectes platessa]|uniref:Uncharacterized protein n=1 Tax=Pleuronectes platessa TaxID=8262 RepID=A0A9N7VDC8_PLEPL|nr:unnamed protein product [Pleuronectes platessa]
MDVEDEEQLRHMTGKVIAGLRGNSDLSTRKFLKNKHQSSHECVEREQGAEKKKKKMKMMMPATHRTQRSQDEEEEPDTLKRKTSTWKHEEIPDLLVMRADAGVDEL